MDAGLKPVIRRSPDRGSVSVVLLGGTNRVRGAVPDNRELGATPLRRLLGGKRADPARLCDPVMQPQQLF